MTSSRRLSLRVVSFLPCSFSLCPRHDHSIGVGGRVINRLLVTVIYWFLAFYVALWHFGGTWSFLAHPALAVPWIWADYLDLLLSYQIGPVAKSGQTRQTQG